jgi:glyoxalase family protein
MSSAIKRGKLIQKVGTIMSRSAGIHHITGITGTPRRNVDFYTRVLGLRMVKRTVNFDDPSTWHLYYGDETGAPGTALTFFVWDRPGGRPGVGQAVETAFAIPESSIGYWVARLVEKNVPHDAPERRFGESVIGLRDPYGLRLELIGSRAAAGSGWAGGEIPAEHAIRGFFGITLWLENPEPTAKILTEVLGFTAKSSEASRQRFAAEGPFGANVDLRTVPDAFKGALGPGTLHHVAFRAAADADQAAMADAARRLGLRPTDQIDRNYFRSVYFREPGGVLFEVATDDPGFTLDEPRESLGTALKLPPWLEQKRAEIEKALPPLE